MNRKVNPDRVEKIVMYINQNIETLFLPPVVLNSFEKINVKNRSGELIDLEVFKNNLTIIDGQHRI